MPPATCVGGNFLHCCCWQANTKTINLWYQVSCIIVKVHFLTLCSEYVHCFINIFFSDSRTPSWTLLFKFIFSCYCSRLQARWKSQADFKLKNSWRPVVFQNIRAAETRLMACGHFRYLLSYIDPASCSSFYHFVVCVIFDWDQQRCVV